MQDFVPLGTGNSRFLKSSIAEDATWEQARELFRKGLFPTDIGPVNEAGVAQKGDPLNKETLLRDDTCEILGLPNTAYVNDAIMQLAVPPGQYIVRATVLTGRGRPAPNVLVEGLKTVAGANVYTSEEGVAFGLATGSPATLTAISDFLDVPANASGSFTLQAGIFNEVTISFNSGTETKATISDSKIVRFSPDVSDFDCSGIGGGSNGARGSNSSFATYGGKGGNAGETVNVSGVKNTGKHISVTVGGVGGNTIVEGVLTARGNIIQGGRGAYNYSNYGDKGAAVVGADNNTDFLYPPTQVGGAGGGGGSGRNDSNTNWPGTLGGKPGGGLGGNSGNPGSPGSLPGSGGGGGGTYNNQIADGGAGKPGLVGFVWRYAT